MAWAPRGGVSQSRVEATPSQPLELSSSRGSREEAEVALAEVLGWLGRAGMVL